MSKSPDLLTEQLADDKELPRLIRERKSEFVMQSVRHALVPELLDKGWEEFQDPNKYVTRLRKRKPTDIFFEDRVWQLFAEMGFHSMNRDRNFVIPYSNDGSLTQQIDVFAADDEIAVVVECKASDSGPKKGNFKTQIEALAGKREGLIASVRKLLANKSLKVVFVFATYDYYLSKPDLERLENFQIHHFDDEIISYYGDLQKHLGTAARYQLEANLFPGLKIPALESKVPAIRGKMGGHTYYSFMMEPDRLLKIGYVLHRSKANKRLMPTYQRIIKKPRLNKIRKFIKEGGFFPNSIVLNIESKKSPKFDLADTQLEGTACRLGVLHLPQKYRSAFVIDGQHRLYGYSDTEFGMKNAIPVVAFLNLARKDQVRLFMEINENQKAVPKNLRHTLNADLHWDSENLRERINALKLQIAQDLGEDLSSPLYDRIIVGENTRTKTRSITLDALKQGLDRGSFFGEVTRSEFKKDGTFYKTDNTETYKLLFPFLLGTFSHLKDTCSEEWELNAGDGGLILSNIGVNSLLQLFSDIVEHLAKSGDIDPKYLATDEVIDSCRAYLDPLMHYFAELEIDERTRIRTAYGTGGPIRFWRILQKTVAEARPDFEPDGMAQYWKDESKAFNTQSYEMIREIEEFLKRDFAERLEKHHGQNWFKTGVHPDVYKDASALAADKNKNIFDPDKEKKPWECLHLIDYRIIAVYAKNWEEIFQPHYTRLGENNISGGKKAKTKWMEKLNGIRNETDHEYSVKQSEFEFLKEIYTWILEKELTDPVPK